MSKQNVWHGRILNNICKAKEQSSLVKRGRPPKGSRVGETKRRLKALRWTEARPTAARRSVSKERNGRKVAESNVGACVCLWYTPLCDFFPFDLRWRKRYHSEGGDMSHNAGGGGYVKLARMFWKKKNKNF